MILTHNYNIDLRGWDFTLETKEGHSSHIFLSVQQSEIERLNYLVSFLNKSFSKFEQFNVQEETPSQSV